MAPLRANQIAVEGDFSDFKMDLINKITEPPPALSVVDRFVLMKVCKQGVTFFSPKLPRVLDEAM